MKLMNADGTTLQDGRHDLVVYKGDNKKMDDAKYYLTLPGTKAELEEKELQASKNPSVFTPSKDSTKDSFQIATLICSTKLTQNGRCGDPMDTDGPGLVLLHSLVRPMIPDRVAPGLLRQDAWQWILFLQCYIHYLSRRRDKMLDRSNLSEESLFWHLLHGDSPSQWGAAEKHGVVGHTVRMQNVMNAVCCSMPFLLTGSTHFK